MWAKLWRGKGMHMQESWCLDRWETYINMYSADARNGKSKEAKTNDSYTCTSFGVFCMCKCSFSREETTFRDRSLLILNTIRRPEKECKATLCIII